MAERSGRKSYSAELREKAVRLVSELVNARKFLPLHFCQSVWQIFVCSKNQIFCLTFFISLAIIDVSR